jgi:macrodomain Ter protein organizer (MatP/YcbG family)
MNKKYTTNIYLDYEVKDKLDIIAKSMQRSLNNTIVFLISDYFKNIDKETERRENILQTLNTIKASDNLEIDRELIYND